MEGRMGRRTFLQLAGAGALYVAESGVSHAQSSTPLGLVLPPHHFERYFQAAGTFEGCNDDAEYSGIFVGFGESNMEGTFVPGKRSLPSAIAQYAKNCGLGAWEAQNYAWKGARNQQIIDTQIKNTDVVARLRNKGQIDFIVNSGGNDLQSVISSPERAAALQSILAHPLQRDTALLVSQIYEVLANFGDSFLSVLEAIPEQYGEQAKSLNVISATNLSQCEVIKTDVINGEVYPFNLDSWWSKQFAYNISVLLNNGIGEAVTRFKKRNAGVPIRIVDIFGLDAKYYMGDEHFGLEGQDVVAARYFEGCK